MEESKLDWCHLHHAAEPIPDPEDPPIHIVEVGGLEIFRSVNLDLATRIQADYKKAVIRTWFPAEAEASRLERQSYQRYCQTPTKPFFKERGDGPALFSVSMKSSCRSKEKQVWVTVPTETSRIG